MNHFINTFSLNILFLFLSIQIATADCGVGLIFHPQNPSVHKNTKIIIEAYGWGAYETLLEDLGDKYPIYLNSKSRKICLIKEKFIKGQYGLVQAIFKLEETLTGGEVYELEVENLSRVDQKYFDNLERWKDGAYEKVHWIAKDEFDTQSPEIIKEIEFSDTELIHFGCGPGVVSNFKFKAKDKSELFIWTELAEIESGESSTYFVLATDNQVSIGHGMCAGAFEMKKGKRYKIRFKFYDINGNTDDEWSGWMGCENPWKKDE